MQKNSEIKTILIIGDWAVDEFWFLVRHHSEISSHTGFTHYRISSKPNLDIFTDLCGPGHVARVLYKHIIKNDGNYSLYGLGKWHDKDTEWIKHLIHRPCPLTTPSFCLNPNACQNVPQVTLQTIDPLSYTTRVIRLYHRVDGNVQQINRIDWVPKSKSEHGEANNEKTTFNFPSLPKNDEVVGIIVHDHKKGVVNTPLIEGIYHKYPHARWFVRTKQQDPEWIKNIESNLDLRLIGPEVAAMLNPWDNWLGRGNKITLQALKAINGFSGENIVLLSPSHEVIARLGKECLTGKSITEMNLQNELNWPSSFFACLIYLLLLKGSKIDKDDIDLSLTLSSESDVSCIPLPNHWQTGIPESNVRKSQLRNSHWNTEVIECYCAINDPSLLNEKIKKTSEFKKLKKFDLKQDLGTIPKENGLHLEIWRSHTEVPNYIAIIEEKKKIINRLGRKLRAFSKGGYRVRPLSIMLHADPGTGKTSLAKALAKAFGFAFIRCDVTQMLQKDDLLDLFDTVATMQARAHNPIMVFVDEINSPIDGTVVYGTFLLPLEEGYYVKRGKVFSLKPCVWIFAGTKVDKEETKLSDFKSRMTMIETIDYKYFCSLCPKNDANALRILKNAAKLEQVYLGASMIRNYFPDVQQISVDILKVFHGEKPEDNPARKFIKWITSLQNIQYGIITRENCKNWDDAEWDSQIDNRLVTLVF